MTDNIPLQTDDEEITALREKIIELRQVIHKQTEEEVSKRWYFEEGVRTVFYHLIFCFYSTMTPDLYYCYIFTDPFEYL